MILGETNFSNKLPITDPQGSILCEAFTNSSSANIKLLKT